jgi:hypothetical protein
MNAGLKATSVEKLDLNGIPLENNSLVKVVYTIEEDEENSKDVHGWFFVEKIEVPESIGNRSPVTCTEEEVELVQLYGKLFLFLSFL